MALRVLSLNVWGGRLHPVLIPYLENAQPDILCLQEVVRTPSAPSEWLTYLDGELQLPQRANLFDDIRAAFPTHEAFFCPTARGILHDSAGKPVWSEFGLATFVRKSYPVIGQALGFVHGDFSARDWGEHPRSRNAHCIRLFDYGGNFTVTITHLHGLRDPSGKEDTPARKQQAEALVGLIERTRLGKERLVVCGDFNVLPSSVTFELLRTLGLSDLVTARGHTDTRTSYYGKAQRFADYMLVTPEVTVLTFEVVREPEVSDHRALLLDMR
jgi:endonuclease/exonuclease/phosphatase family metal-dependent hydrolase